MTCISRDASSYHSYPAQFTLDWVFAPDGIPQVVRSSAAECAQYSAGYPWHETSGCCVRKTEAV
ncbi:hypothetical protein ACFL5O_07750 [Myxococcota bacterium]